MVMLREGLYDLLSMNAVVLGSGRKGFGERGSKGAPLIRGTRGCDLPAMSPRNGPGQTESQTDTGLGPTLIASVESIKNSGEDRLKICQCQYL